MATRRFLAGVLSVLATVAILATLLAFYANRVLVSTGGFTSRAVSVLHNSDVESLIVGVVTDRVLARAGAGQASLQPVLRVAVARAVSSGPLDHEFRAAARSLHRKLVSAAADQLSLTLPGIGPAIASSIGSGSPELAAAVKQIGTITVLDVPIPPSDANDVHDLVRDGKDSSDLLLASLALLLLALIISPSRRRTLIGVGLGMVVSGLAIVVIYFAGRGIVVSDFSAQDVRMAAHAVWGVYLGELEIWGIVLAGAGALAAGGAGRAMYGTRRR